MSSSVDEIFLEELVGVLRDIHLEAIIVGNAASILHNAPVLTQDVDLLVRDTKMNRDKLKKLADAIGGYGPTDISNSTSTQRILGGSVPVDILYNKMGGNLRFESVRSRSVKIHIGIRIATVASLEDVIKSKIAANRPKDRAVLPILRDTLRVNRALEK